MLYYVRILDCYFGVIIKANIGVDDRGKNEKGNDSFISPQVDMWYS